MRELVARVNALSRRSSGDRATALRVADLNMNLLTREVTRAGEKIVGLRLGVASKKIQDV